MSATLTPAQRHLLNGEQRAQRARALQSANAVRVAASHYKRDLAALGFHDGRRKLAADLTDPDAIAGPLGAIPILVAVMAISRFGETTATLVARRAQIFNARRRVRDLTARQRELVALELTLVRR